MSADVEQLLHPVVLAPQARRIAPLAHTVTRATRPIVYHSSDPVNRAAIEELARPFGFPVEHREPRDGLASAAVILIDSDFWWTSLGERQQGLLALVALSSYTPVLAVHGYQLGDEEIDWLREKRIYACTRLDRELVAWIAKELADLLESISNLSQAP